MTVTDNAHWHTKEAHSVAVEQSSDLERGLSSDEAAQRLLSHGPNETTREQPRPVISLIVSQFADFMNLVLLTAAGISGMTGDVEDALAIIALVLLNGTIGAFQSVRAEHAMAELRKLGAFRATVVRDGVRMTIPASEVVPGDVALLEAGASVPADIRLIACVQLKISEAALTGESIAVDKATMTLSDHHAPLAERTDMAYMGTSVAYGSGSGIVVATGMETELGKIAALLKRVELPRTPLQNRLARFGRQLGIAIAIVCLALFAMGLARGEPVTLMLLTSISLAVAAIPEALPTVLAVMLALGARNLARRHALVRKASAIETLGSVSHICTDKTGTLTLNEMHVVELTSPGCGRIAGGFHGPGVLPLLSAAAMSCSSDAGAREHMTGRWLGDPTEVAIWRAAVDAGFDATSHGEAGQRLLELPFDSKRMRMTTLYRTDAGFTAYMKGAPEAVVARCDACMGDVAATFDRAAQLAAAASMAADGERVLAVSMRSWSGLAKIDPVAESLESGHTLLGFIGMQDPPRPNARHSVDVCRAAGIAPVMITGDHPVTARAIARSLGILAEGQSVLTGPELDALNDKALEAAIESVGVFARLDPPQKIRIVEALQARGHCVAVTGDGINDAPALTRADIGVAMGKGGTDVAREAASIVLLDDDFSTIVVGIEEGRRIYDNVRRFVRYALTGNTAEVCVVVAAPFLGLPLPLLPIQILWINLVTDGLPGLALAAEPAESDIMRRPPRARRESLFAAGTWQHIVWVSIAMSLVTLATQGFAWSTDQAQWQTMTFTVLSLSQMGYVIAIRSARRSVFELGLLSNRALAGAVALTFALQIAAIYVPFMNTVLRTEPLDAWQLACSLALSCVVFVLVELEKYVRRHGLFRRARHASRREASLR
ncbi:cation-transporting P-type ATPase [Caballeronia sp. AZ1_KS37]|uniref:cation-translocating P-type ATPase n=1 Tax=Caballeronia sp. AZ1_KS37 TaxID=2921756 RepID=UPI002027DA75|nr:cation-transporting P-type ATPase [Caballeronia sp. AZ1_KS37]